ncbi:MAG: SAM-dependent methyltransferase, partial [Chitinophagaceae bacterium]
VLEFIPPEKYDLWHDRATFHFLTTPENQKKYIQIAYKALKDNGYLLLATFSNNGPDKCSGLQVQQYSEDSLIALLLAYFKRIKCIRQEHPTPFNPIQQFLFCSFKKI